jgi:type II secretory ATPase GspE/PulE/Tfp pilus assembly ATPase PilB-like protein
MILSGATLSPEFCIRYLIAPIIESNGTIRLMICPQTNANIISVLQFIAGRKFDFIRSSQEEIIAENQKYAAQRTDEIGAEVRKSDDADHTAIERVNSVISEALRMKASDIHLEPFEDFLAVRYRIDGILQEQSSIKKEMMPSFISRIKIISGLDIAEKRRPQDGRIRFQIEDRVVDIRVSVAPTDFGEKIVLRLLDKAGLRLDLNLLGFEDDDRRIFESKIRLSNGIILITGPTGSGKTTTLYAALNQIRSPEVNITTIEDPIEYNLPGINQMQIKPEINLTFASALRAILRQDPDVIMVGEIRDRETLDNALRASLTGHLVLSTLHTNSAVSSIARLIDLGAEPFLLSSSLRLVIAQRLVRLICPFCQGEVLDLNERTAALALGLNPENLFKRKGCPHCFHIGCRDRTAIYELLSIDEEISDMIMHMAGVNEILAFAKKRGMQTLRERGIELIKRGKTLPSEVWRESC